MMTEYTESDFAAASFARKGDRTAIRIDVQSANQWQTWGSWLSDADMAADGWTPVVEVTPVPSGKFVDLEFRVYDEVPNNSRGQCRRVLRWLDEHPEAVPVAVPRPIEMTGKFADLDRRVLTTMPPSVPRAGAVRDTLRWLDKHPEAVPRLKTDDDPLDYLQHLWDRAEVREPREGDVLIGTTATDGWTVWETRVDWGAPPPPHLVRVLSRAPRTSIADRVAEVITDELPGDGPYRDIAAAILARFDVTEKDDDE